MFVRLGLVVGLCLAAGSTLVAAEPKQPSPWAERIQAQPFDKEPFHAVRVPSWVQETIGCGYTLSVMSGQQRAEAVKHGVTISEMGFVDPFYTYYDSKFLKRRSPYVPAEGLTKDLAEYKRLGVRVLGVYPPCLQAEVYELHPDWRRVDRPDGQVPQIDMKQFPHGGMLCLLGPYGDFFIDVLAEITTEFPQVDAFSFDGLHYGGFCYCEHCRANFKRDSGKEIPPPNMDDPNFRRYQHWADRKMENLIQRMQTRLKGIKPEMALITWTTNAGRWGHFLSIPRNMPARMNLLLDAPDQEFWLDETNRGQTIVPAFANAYIWATTNHRVAFSEPYLMSHGNPYGKDGFPAHEVERRMMLSLAYGAAPSIAALQPPRLQRDLYDVMDRVLERKPWLTNKQPEPWAALLMSDNTRNFYGRSAGQVEDRYMSHVLGAFRAGVEEHLPTTVINDWNLNDEDLARYKVLVLPNSACLDDAQVAAIDRFVKRGGGLVASLDTSLFNEFGDPREDFALSDVLGVRWRGVATAKSQPQELDVNFAQAIGPDYWEKRKNAFDLRVDFKSELATGPTAGRLPKVLDDEPVTFKGPALAVQVVDPKAATAATYAGKGVGEAAGPAIVTRKHGEGRVVYFATGIDAAHYSYSYPYQRSLWTSAVRWAGNSPQPVEVMAPMCVHANLMRQTTKNGERLVLHLYNDVNTTAAHGLPVDDVPLREETLPIHDIRVRFAPNYRISKISWEPEGIELASEVTPEGTTVAVPKLAIHGMVVAELDDSPK